jgi:hypothetical protein
MYLHIEICIYKYVYVNMYIYKYDVPSWFINSMKTKSMYLLYPFEII